MYLEEIVNIGILSLEASGRKILFIIKCHLENDNMKFMGVLSKYKPSLFSFFFSWSSLISLTTVIQRGSLVLSLIFLISLFGAGCVWAEWKHELTQKLPFSSVLTP